MVNKYTKKYRDKYTRSEIAAMADRCYNRCLGRSCPNYRAVSYRDTTDVNRIFMQSNTGCYYSYELPWGLEKWCCFYPPKKTTEIDRLKSLTFNNLINTIQGQSR